MHDPRVDSVDFQPADVFQGAGLHGYSTERIA